jgi:hypothetical protein
VRYALFIAFAACGGSTEATAPDSGASSAPDAAVEEEVCPAAACPASPVPGVSEGGGLVAADRCQSHLEDRGDRDTRAALIGGLEAVLPTVSVADVVASANRTAISTTVAVAGFSRGFAWNAGDDDVTYWYPQGMTGSGDASDDGTVGGHEVALATWYYKTDDPGAPSTVNRGVRVSFVDLAASPPIYRHVLLVDPVERDGRPDFAAVPVHAGGVAWFDHWLYVVDTSHGFRVFDLDHILDVDTADDGIGYDATRGVYRAWGYAYVIPQVAAYELADDACATRFSFVSIDHTTTPVTLLTGEYDADLADRRIFRWALREDGALALEHPLEIFHTGQTRMQGAASADGHVFLSCSSQVGSAGRLYRVDGDSSTAFTWPRGPEDLSIWPATGELWTLTEVPGARTVFAVHLDAYLR